MTLKVKICGISEEKALKTAVDNKADFVGFVFFEKSPRFVSIAKAAELCFLTPSSVKRVGLFVNPSDEELERVLSKAELDVIQLHGKETVARVKEIKNKTGLQIIKAVGVSLSEDINDALVYEQVADWLLFDARPPEKSEIPGGNAVSFDWKIMKDSGINQSKEWILAGGLDETNIEEAILETNAQIVDVSSGVEVAKGQKSPEKIEKFLKKVKNLKKK